MGELRPWHIAVLVVVLILLFGAKRLPDAARSLGRSMRILKAETKGLADGDEGDRSPDGTRNAPDATPVRPLENRPAQAPGTDPVQAPRTDPVQRLRDE